MRNENKCVKELELRGWRTYKVKGSTRFNKNVDIFGLFDVLAIKAFDVGTRLKLVQVKSNRKPSIEPYFEFREKYKASWLDIEVWVWKDRKGFRKIFV